MKKNALTKFPILWRGLINFVLEWQMSTMRNHHWKGIWKCKAYYNTYNTLVRKFDSVWHLTNLLNHTNTHTKSIPTTPDTATYCIYLELKLPNIRAVLDLMVHAH